jgi:hypothetical protein
MTPRWTTILPQTLVPHRVNFREGPSDGLVGSMVHARSQGTRAGLIKTRSFYPLLTAHKSHSEIGAAFR